MPTGPDYERFCELAADVHFVPVYRRVLSDALTPVSAFHRLDAGACGCLFESVIGGEKVGRYSFLSAEPYLLLDAKRNKVRITRFSDGQPQVEELTSKDPMSELKARLNALKAAKHPELPPFVGGAIGYAGYDVIRYSENLPNSPPDDRDLPDLSFGFYDRMVIFDNIRKTIDVVAMARVRDDAGKALDLQQAYDAAVARVEQTIAKLSKETTKTPSASASNTSARAISFRSSSASVWPCRSRCPRSNSIGPCAS